MRFCMGFVNFVVVWDFDSDFDFDFDFFFFLGGGMWVVHVESKANERWTMDLSFLFK